MSDAQFKGIGMTSQRTRDRLAARLQQQGIRNEQVIEVMRELPRHLFVDEALASRAYEDTALPIGHGQTISQPYIVARMTEALLAEGTPERVLEVGTGSGYQAAVLARLVREVYSVERIRALYLRTRELMFRLKLGNVRLRHSDGSWGWEREAPFEAIIVTAAPEEVPESLLLQLAPGGRMIIPVGGASQELQLITRKADCFERRVLEGVSFVPLLQGEVPK